jgi:hypothetical protein
MGSLEVRKLIAAVAMSLALAFGASAQTAPGSGTTAPTTGTTAPDTGTTATAPKKASRKKAAPKKSSKKKTSKKKKAAHALPKGDVDEERRKALESLSPALPPVAPAEEAAKGPEDNEPPVLTHTPVTTAKRGKPLTITAHAIDPSGVFGPFVYLRKKGLPGSEYIPMRMAESKTGAAGEYALDVPAALVSVDALEYYIEAWDNAGNGPARAGSPESPLPVKVEEEQKIIVKPPAEPTAPTDVVGKQKSAPPAITTHTAVMEGQREQSLVNVDAPAKAATTKAPIEAPARNTLIGLGIDAGFPGVAGFTLLVRPLWWLRLNAGLAYDYAGFGYRGGLSLAPCWCAVTPTLNLDAGHYLSGDFNKFGSVSDPNVKALLSHVTYTFATAQIGLEFGSQRWFNFYLRGGLAYFESTFSGADLTVLAQGKIGSDPSTRYKAGDGRFTSVAPCVSLGFHVFVY